MTRCVVHWTHYNTDKTVTHDLVIGTEHGIMSMKVVKSRFAKKVNVYTGFDTLPASTVVTGNTTTFRITGNDYLEHRYFDAQEKARAKWHGVPINSLYADSIGDGLVHALTPTFYGEIAHLLAQGATRLHYAMLSGEIPPISSNPVRSEKAATTRAARLDRNAAQAQSDAMWGIF